MCVFLVSYLSCVCLVEGVRANTDELELLVETNRRDVRRCLLQLQYWSLSGAGIEIKQEIPKTILQQVKHLINIYYFRFYDLFNF